MSFEDLENTSSEGSDVRICVTCGAQYSEGTVCPVDGGLLSPVQTDSLIGSKFGDRYAIVSLLGRGGMSTVYKAHHRYMDKMVAIKLLVVSDIISLKRFQLEAKLASNLAHPNIVTVFDFGVSETGQPYLVMDYLDGKTLSAEVAQNGPMPVERAVPIFTQACDALSYAHKRDVIHRDLKPSNFILIKDESGNDIIKLVDFGIAKVLGGEGEDGLNLTKTGEVFGSPLYMSPEMCQGKKLDARADIYSMGCVMYEVLMGRPPFVGSNALETIQKHIHESPPPFLRVTPDLPDVPDQLEHIVFKCLERDPDNRYTDMMTLWTDLELFRNGITTRSPAIQTLTNLPAMAEPLAAQTVAPVEPTTMHDQSILQTVVDPQQQSILTEGSPAERALMAVATLMAVAGIILLFVTTSKRMPAPVDTKKVAGIEKVNAQWQQLKDSGEKQFQQSHYAVATKYLTEAAEAAKAFGPDDPRVAATLNDLGNAYYKRDLYPQAEENLKKALTIRVEAYGENSRPAADSMTDLAGVYCAEGKTTDAENLLNKALDTRKKNSGAESEDYADSLKALAALYNKTGRPKEALGLLQKTLKIRLKNLGPDHPDIAETEISLAMDYQMEGDLGHAKRFYKAAHATAEKALGPRSLLVADCLVGEGSAAFLAKQYSASEQLFREALAIREKILGFESLRTAEVLSCLGVLKDTQGKDGEAEAFLKRALDIKELVLGHDHAETVRSAKNYASVLHKLGRDQEAKLIMARAQGKP